MPQRKARPWWNRYPAWITGLACVAITALSAPCASDRWLARVVLAGLASISIGVIATALA